LPLREIAARAEMPPSKAHLYLVSFVREDMAYQDLSNGHYGLGSFAIQLGLAAIRQLDVVSLASDVLNDLRDQTDCAVYLSLWGDRGPCIVAKADGTLQGAFSIRLGYILPLKTSATGLVYLAHLPKSESARAMKAQNAYQAASKRAKVPSAKELNADIEKTRRAGYATTVGNLHRNFAGIAVPILDYGNQLAAAITLLGPTDYVVGERQKAFTTLLVEKAQNISERLGAAAAEG
jgi:DNA-binding IclR family transcriptional regulator